MQIAVESTLIDSKDVLAMPTKLADRKLLTMYIITMELKPAQHGAWGEGLKATLVETDVYLAN